MYTCIFIHTHTPGGRHGNLLQYSCLEKPMNRGARWATVHGAAKSGTRPKQCRTHTRIVPCMHHSNTSILTIKIGVPQLFTPSPPRQPLIFLPFLSFFPSLEFHQVGIAEKVAFSD